MSQTLDPTFYRSPAEAIAAPAERLAYVAAFDPAGRAKRRDDRARLRPVLGRLRPGGGLERATHRRQ